MTRRSAEIEPCDESDNSIGLWSRARVRSRGGLDRLVLKNKSRPKAAFSFGASFNLLVERARFLIYYAEHFNPFCPTPSTANKAAHRY
jgi:hypothetical protein